MTFLKAEKPSRFVKSLWIVSLACLVILCSCRTRKSAYSTDATGKPLFTTLARGSYSGIDQSVDITITSQEKWEELWNEVHRDYLSPVPALPEVDFAAETVAAAFMGSRPTGGYSIEIEKICRQQGKYTAVVRTVSPQPGEMLTMAITRPFHIIKIDRPEMEIEFIRK